MYKKQKNKQDTKCGYRTFQCLNGKCIHSTFVCDGDYDCDDKSDEIPEMCMKKKGKCNTSLIYIDAL